MPRRQRFVKRIRDALPLRVTFAAGKSPQTQDIRRRPRKEAAVTSDSYALSEEMRLALTNPNDLIDQKGYGIVWDMRDGDETVHAVGEAFMRTVLGRDWHVVPASDDGADQTVAEFVEWNLRTMRGTFAKDLAEILTAYWAGFSMTEKCYEVADTRDFGQRVVLKALKTRSPDGWNFYPDKHGNLLRLTQTVRGTEEEREPERYIHYVYKREFDSFHGLPAVLAVHRPYHFKRHVLNFWAMALERFAGGTLKGTIPKDHPDPAAAQARLEEIFRDFQNKSDLIEVEGLVVELMEMQGAGLTAYENAIRLFNQMIATGLMAPEQLGFSPTEGGAYNKAVAQQSLWFAIVQDLVSDIENDIVGEQLIPQLVGYNYDVAEYPQFRFDPLTEDDKFKLAEALTKAYTAGLIKAQESDEAWFRERFGLPEVDEDREEPQAAPDPTPPAPDDGADDDIPETDEDDGEDEQFAATVTFAARRKLTPYEQRVNFAAIEDRWDAVIRDTTDAIAAIMKDMRDDLIGRVGKIVGEGKHKPDRKAIKELQLKGWREINDALTAGMALQYMGGKKDIADEVRRGTGRKVAFSEQFADTLTLLLLPEKARRLFKNLPITRDEALMIRDKAFWITGSQQDKVLSEAKAVLYKGLERGDPAWTRTQLRSVLDKYHESYKKPTSGGLVELRPGVEVNPAWHVETIVRTNLGHHYNLGRKAMMEHPDVAGVIEAYQYTAILDENTTEYCQDRDTHVFDKDDCPQPDAHFNCRSFLVPVFEGEPYDLSRAGEFTSARAAGF